MTQHSVIKKLRRFSARSWRMLERRAPNLKSRPPNCHFQLEELEARVVLTGVVISEFQASNGTTIADEDGEFSDWIELHNESADPVDITNWHLTDDANDLSKWTFGSVDQPAVLQPDEFRLVFASAKDRNDPANELHTNFSLSNNGEFLGLVEDDDVTIASQFAPAYPTQLLDHSYGLTSGRETEPLVEIDAPVSAFVPSDDSLALDWTASDFNDGLWESATTAVGYERLAPRFTLRDEFDSPLGPEWTVDIPAGGTSTVSVADGKLRMDVPVAQDSTADRGLAPIVFQDPPDQNSNYDTFTKITFVSGNGAGGLMVYDELNGQQVLSVQVNRRSSFLTQIETSALDQVQHTRVLFNANTVFLRMSRDPIADTWTTYSRVDETEPWTEMATLTEGDGDVPHVGSPKIGILTRTITSAAVADYEFFEVEVAGEHPTYGPQIGLAVPYDAVSQITAPGMTGKSPVFQIFLPG